MDNSGRLSKFAEYVSRYGESGTSGRLDEVIRSVQSGTVFAPSNEAFERLEQEMGADEFERMMETQGATILGMHFLDQRIPAQDIRISNPQNDIKVRRIMCCAFQLPVTWRDVCNRGEAKSIFKATSAFLLIYYAAYKFAWKTGEYDIMWLSQ